MPASSPPKLGDRLGRYRLLAPLGAGGMGLVFLAEDERLGRMVAIKLLPEDVAADPGRLSRFEQEAVAASKLNHPNILVVHELGEHEGRRYLVTERVEGESLRQRLERGPLPLREAVEVARQVAAALAVAHRAGIVHRDVKPENLMLRPDGWVKLLDFGLAKLAPFATDVDSRLATRPGFATAPGTVLGTVRYMSPEQARGGAVDARSDLFSLGAVLYETVTGRPPFPGDSAADVVSAILREEPQPISRYVDDAPEALALVLSRCLRKDVATRVQSAEELAAELRDLGTRLDREAMVDPSGETQIWDGTATAVATRPGGPRAGLSRPGGSRASGARGSGSSFATVLGGVRRRRVLTGTLAVLAVAALAVVLGGRLLDGDDGDVGPAFGSPRPSRVTSDGRVVAAVVSPDGRYVSYSVQEGGQFSLRLRQVRTGSDVEIVPPGPEPVTRLALSPDGEHLYFVRGQETGVLMRVPVLGGVPVQLLSSLESAVAFSPSGDRFAYLDWDAARGVQVTVLARADGTRERVLVERPPGRALQPFVGLAWHPDGRSLAAVGIRAAEDGGHQLEALSLPIDGAEPSRLGDATFRWVTALAWRPDGRALFLSIESAATGWNPQLVEMTLPDGALHPVTSDLESYDGASVTADGTSLLTVRTEVAANLWTLDPSSGGARAERLTGGGHDGLHGLAWAPDGAVVHIAADYRVYRVEPDRRSWLLTPGDNNQQDLAVCPDGELVVESWRERGEPGTVHRGTALWRLSPRGEAAHLLAIEPHASPEKPVCSPDGRFLVYRDFEGADPGIFRVGAAGGPRLRLHPGPAAGPAISPDGRRVAFFAGHPRRAVVVAIDGGKPLFELTPPEGSGGALRWAPDGQSLTVAVGEDGIDDLWLLPIDGGEPHRLTDFGDLQIFAFAWSPDGRLVLSRGSRRQDAVLLTAGS